MSAARTQAIADINTQILTADQLKEPEYREYNNDPLPTEPTNDKELNVTLDRLQANSETERDTLSTLYYNTTTFFKRLGMATKARAYRANRWLGGIPTPGSITLPLGILLFLFLIFIPINGHTRIRWLWETIVGSASITHNETGSGEVKQPVNQPTQTILPQSTQTIIADTGQFDTNNIIFQYQNSYMVLGAMGNE
jgi:hypothetical protein